MDEIDYDKEFEKLTDSLHISDPEVAISLSDIAEVLESVHEACAFLSEYLKVQLSLPANIQLEFPDNLVSILPHFRRTSEIIADELHAILCVEGDEEEGEEGEESD